MIKMELGKDHHLEIFQVSDLSYVLAGLYEQNP